MQQYIDLTLTPPEHAPNDADPTGASNTAANEHIHNFSDIPWDAENEPPPHPHNQPAPLYHLLTITGLLLVAHYPPEHTLGEHYLAWAPLTDQPTLTIH